jgi:hypothetical protein
LTPLFTMASQTAQSRRDTIIGAANTTGSGSAGPNTAPSQARHHNASGISAMLVFSTVSSMNNRDGPVLERRQVDRLVELPGEGALVGVAACQGDLCDRPVVVTELRSGRIDAELEKHLACGEAEEAPHAPVELIVRHAGRGRQRREGWPLFQMVPGELHGLCHGQKGRATRKQLMIVTGFQYRR